MSKYSHAYSRIGFCMLVRAAWLEHLQKATTGAVIRPLEYEVGRVDISIRYRGWSHNHAIVVLTLVA